MSKRDIDGVKTKVLIQHYQIFRGQFPPWSPKTQGPQTSLLSLPPIWKKFKHQRWRLLWKPYQQLLRAPIRLINRNEDWQKGQGPWAWPLSRDLNPLHKSRIGQAVEKFQASLLLESLELWYQNPLVKSWLGPQLGWENMKMYGSIGLWKLECLNKLYAKKLHLFYPNGFQRWVLCLAGEYFSYLVLQNQNL